MLTTIFYVIDEFCKHNSKKFEKNLLTDGEGKRDRAFRLTLSDIMTIAIYYHHSGYKSFKDYYEKHVLVYMQQDFNGLVSYNRFLELRQKALIQLVLFNKSIVLKNCSGISFVDSFALEVSHIKRASSHKTFRGLASKGKTSTGWFFGFKLHMVINHAGEIVDFHLTPGNVADNNKGVLDKLTKKLFGKAFGDRGYLVNPEYFQKLYLRGVHLITGIKKNMKNKLMPLIDKLLLKKRGIIETVGGILKESLSLEHSRHRSVSGFLCHVATTIVAYHFKQQKPSIAVPIELLQLIS